VTRRLLLAALLALAAAPAAAAQTLPACGGMVTTTCVVSVERNGVTVPYPSGPDYEILAMEIAPPANEDFYVNVARAGGAWTLDLADVWEITLNTGGIAPSETFARARDVEVVRGGPAGSRTVAFTFRPVRMADDACSSSGACPSIAGRLSTGYLDAWVNDLSYIDDPADAAAMRGFDLATNADWVSSPLQLDWDTNSIVLDAANAHFEPDGTTVFVGSAEFRLPNAMLARLYNVDDPASLTASAFRVTAGTGPAPTVSVTVGSGEVHVTMENITFSKRKLRIHGDMRPRKPRDVRAVRRDGRTTGVVRFRRALPRGSRVRGYRVLCLSGAQVRRGKAGASPVRVRNLDPRRSYRCSVRATSRAGLGRAASFRLL
jgi:hypothetical protein